MSIRQHARKKRKVRTPLKWLVVITIVTVLLAAVLGLGGGAVQFIDHYFDYRDDSYRPMDLERIPAERNP